MSNWEKLATSLEELHFTPDGIATAKWNDTNFCVGKHPDGFFAFMPTCPHASAHFVEGWMDAKGSVVCPLHQYKFCIKTGRNVSGEGYYLKHWPVTVREDGVYIYI
jgi:nitrite reductase/ring-hydroxylating ferredoxin subunit